jgi:hypothetical protein
MLERIVDRFDGLLRARHPPAPVDDVRHRPALILHLVQEADVVTLGKGRHPGRDDQQRDRIVMSGGGGGDQVRQSRTGGDDANSRPVRGAGVAVGGVADPLLVPRGDVADPGAGQRLVERQGVGPGDAKDVINAMRCEGADDCLTAAHSSYKLPTTGSTACRQATGA